jgi:MFS family permease
MDDKNMSQGTPPSTTSVTRAGWYTLLLVSATQMMSLLDRNILAILATDIKEDLDIGDAELGLLYGTVFALFYAIFSLPLGRLADGWIRTRLLAICIAVWSFATGLAAFAGGFALLALSRLGVGIGEAAAQPAGTSLVYDYFPKSRRGFAMAAIASAIALGLGLSLVLGGVTAEWWDARYTDGNEPFGFRGWQFAFVVAALPGVFLAVLLWRLKEPKRGVMDGIESPEDPHPFKASAEVLGSVLPVTNWFTFWREGATYKEYAINLGSLVLIIASMAGLTSWASAFSPRPSLEVLGVTMNPHAMQWGVVGIGLYALLNLAQSLRLADKPLFAVLMSPSLLLAITVGSLQMVINYGLMGFTPLFLIQEHGLSPSQTGLQFGILATVLGIIGPMISGPVSDWVNTHMPGKGRIWVVIVSLGLSPFPAILAYTSADTFNFYLWFTVQSLLLTMWFPPLYAAMFDLVLPRMRAITFSIYLVAYTILGLGIGPYAVGMISDANGGQLGDAIISILWVAPIIVICLFALLFRIQRDEAGLLDRARDAGEPI